MYRRFAGKVALAVVSVGLLVVGAASAGSTFQVRGVQSPNGSAQGCGPGVLGMTGNGPGLGAGLIGCWTILTAPSFVVTPSGVVVGTGTEEFVGCLDLAGDGRCGIEDRSGTLRFSMNYSVKYDPAFTALQHGRCHHPITGGSGGFEGATGVLRFKDDPATGCSYYSGHLSLTG